jgi:hypothetical protein
MKGWFWAWQNKLMTFIAFSTKRGLLAFKITLQTDLRMLFWFTPPGSSHFKTPCKTYQLCIAHLLRELIFFEQKYQSKCATNFKTMLFEVLELKKN